MIRKIKSRIKDIIMRDSFVKEYKKESNIKSKIHMQMLVSLAFLILSVTNIISKSYIMLACTGIGFINNIIFTIVTIKKKKGIVAVASTIITCSLLFVLFLIYGGNDGFACLWVILVPVLSMASMDFIFGFCASLFFQIFIIIVFWTPASAILQYPYNEQFRIRFPLLYFISFLLGLFLTVSMQKSEYNEYINMIKLKKLTDNSWIMARTDPLTKLANRRYAYEEFENKYAQEDIHHCIVMGDIDDFKLINDTYGHEFGDEVLLMLAQCINETLPEDYLKVRWGGEEFLFATNESIDKTFVQIEKLRKTIEDKEFIFKGITIRITITFGIAEYFHKDDLGKAIINADKRLYHGKQMTKNCIVKSDY